MYKSCKCVPKTCCERYKRHQRSFVNTNKEKTNKDTAKKHPTNSDKSSSTGIINKTKESKVITPKKTTRSDLSFNHLINTNIDYCENCGDVASKPGLKPYSSGKIPKNQVRDTYNMPFSKISHSTSNKNSIHNDKNEIRQFYRNEKFNQSSHSLNMENLKKISLNTILEQSEKISDTERSVFEIYPESDQEMTFMDPDDCENLRRIKEFRSKNFFECHSAKSRINNLSVASLNHKCAYRFYLNDRLFPVPLNTDYDDNIRCIDCYLPLEKSIPESKINGTLQAKVKLNGEVQDMLLMLPVNNSFIVKEKRREVQNKDESIYFGIIKLDLNGNSVFNSTLPEDSLALRYQKGFKEFSKNEKYEYESIDSNDVIII